jgi:SAM-dependent methyltransferase
METATLDSLEGAARDDEHAVPCPVCGGVEFGIVRTPRDLEAERRWLRGFYKARVKGGPESLKDRTEFTQSEPTHVARCLDCGTLLRDPRPTPEALHALYAQDSYGHDALEALAANEADFFQARVRELHERLPPPARILEIGAFVGAFLVEARNAGYLPTGLDVGEETVAFMQGRGLDVLRGDIGETSLPEAAWDGVLAWNTFDQLPDPHALLDRAATLLKPGGLLVLRVPNGEFETQGLRLEARSSPRRAAALRRARAYNNFMTFPYLAGYTPASLRRLLESHGCQVERARGDTLLKLADAETLPCAAAEEQRIKRAVRRFCRCVEAETGEIVAPWLELYARRPL